MSSRATGTSSLMQKYCCLRREPQPLCSRLKEVALVASVAEKSRAGMDPSPKETVSDAMDRAAMLLLTKNGANSHSRSEGYRLSFTLFRVRFGHGERTV